MQGKTLKFETELDQPENSHFTPLGGGGAAEFGPVQKHKSALYSKVEGTCASCNQCASVGM